MYIYSTLPAHISNKTWGNLFQKQGELISLWCLPPFEGKHIWCGAISIGLGWSHLGSSVSQLIWVLGHKWGSTQKCVPHPCQENRKIGQKISSDQGVFLDDKNFSGGRNFYKVRCQSGGPIVVDWCMTSPFLECKASIDFHEVCPFRVKHHATASEKDTEINPSQMLVHIQPSKLNDTFVMQQQHRWQIHS